MTDNQQTAGTVKGVSSRCAVCREIYWHALPPHECKGTPTYSDNQQTDEMRAQVLGQALITITRQEHDHLKRVKNRYEAALREAREALIGWESRNGGMHTRSDDGHKAIATIDKLLGGKVMDRNLCLLILGLAFMALCAWGMR